MTPPFLTATAVEKLKRLAKQHRDRTGLPLGLSLDVVARESGYANWKRVTELAASAPSSADHLLEGKHRGCLTWVASQTGKLLQVHSVSELLAALGGVKPFFIRRPCSSKNNGQPCLCELDPFATAVQANIHLDVGDKHDFWDYLFTLGSPARTYRGWEMRSELGLATSDDYPNEYLTILGNDDRSNSLNPNNQAFKASKGNRSNQLNPNFDPESLRVS